MNELESKLAELENRKEELQSEIDNFDCSDYVDDSQYNDWLDEVYGEVEIAGMSYCTSRVLREIDPIAYNCVHSDYCETLDKTDFPEFQDLEFELARVESEIESMEYEIEEENENEI
jgi:peptidoglycan hydrolase CwlO-like protein